VRLAGSLGELAPLWSWGVPRKDGMGLAELIWCVASATSGRCTPLLRALTQWCTPSPRRCVACVTSALERLHAQVMMPLPSPSPHSDARVRPSQRVSIISSP